MSVINTENVRRNLLVLPHTFEMLKLRDLLVVQPTNQNVRRWNRAYTTWGMTLWVMWNTTLEGVINSLSYNLAVAHKLPILPGCVQSRHPEFKQAEQEFMGCFEGLVEFPPEWQPPLLPRNRNGDIWKMYFKEISTPRSYIERLGIMVAGHEVIAQGAAKTSQWGESVLLNQEDAKHLQLV